ncbi:MAG: cytochrome-c peroxidase [Bernardetiaceae bacterium]|nr:cytochrome-c peroxidase [Bernardetiaceae bacterium]
MKYFLLTKNTNFQSLIVLLFLSFLFISCNSHEPTEPPLEIRFEPPAHFPEVAYDLNTNPITTEGFLLGKALFFEGDLSRDGTISCGSCHIPTSAFTHHGHDVSHGIDDRLGRRNATPIMNLAWHRSFFWDGGVHHLDLTSLVPIEDEREMDEDFARVLEKLAQNNDYPRRFERAFGSPEINTVSVLKALSQFMIIAVSANSPYDKYARGEALLSDLELQGLKIYEEKCASCHSGTLFTDLSFRNNGLFPKPRPDKGRYEITLNPDDEFKFKVPSLRNLRFTAPYMHDGRFRTLDEVYDHYESQVQDMPTLDPLLRSENNKLGIRLSSKERTALTAFLETLNDADFVTNPLFQE